MKKLSWLAVLIFVVLGLAACGAKEKELEALETKMELLVEENKLATEKISELEQQIEKLELQLAQAEGQENKEETRTIQILEPDDQLLSYQVTTKEIPSGTIADEIQKALAEAVSEVPVRSVKDNGDGTVTIDFDRAYVTGPQMTSSAQVGVFLDQLKYVMYTNFSQIKSYDVRADGEPTSFGETIVFTEAFVNEELQQEEMYLPIKGE